MSNKDFDKKIRADIKNHDSQIDVDAFWASIEPEVDLLNKEDNRKNKIPFFIFLALISICGYILLGFDFVEKNQNIVSVNSEHQAMSIVSEIKNNEKQKKSSTKNIKKAKEIETKTILKDFGKNADEDLVKKPTSSSVFSNSLIPKKQFPIDLEIEKDNSTSATQPIAEPINYKIQIKDSPFTLVKKSNALTLLPKRTFPIRKNKNVFLISEEYYYKKSINKFSKRTFSGVLGLQLGGGFAQKKLENSNSESDSYFIMREGTETTRGVTQIGINAGLKHQSGVGIFSGLHFSQIIESFRFKGNTVEPFFDENGIVAYQVTLVGDTIPILDSLMYDQEWSHDKRFNNFYRMLDIPVLIGFEKRKGNWTVGLRTGLFINLRLKTKGMVFDEDFDFVYLEKNQEKIFSNKVGMSYYIGGVGKYHFKNNFSITIQPHLRIIPKSITQENTWTQQKYNLMSCDLGIEYEF